MTHSKALDKSSAPTSASSYPQLPPPTLCPCRGRCCQSPSTRARDGAEGLLPPGWEQERTRDRSRAGASASGLVAFLSSAAMALAQLCCCCALTSGNGVERGEPSATVPPSTQGHEPVPSPTPQHA